jgi:ABC-2 type transport system permease protein
VLESVDSDPALEASGRHPSARGQRNTEAVSDLGQLIALVRHLVLVQLGERRVFLLALLEPLLMLFVLSTILGPIADVHALPPGSTYTDYLFPALLITTGIGPAFVSGIRLVNSADSGIVLRFRSMAIKPSVVLLAFAVSDLVRLLLQLLVLVLLAMSWLDYRPGAGVRLALAAVVVASLSTLSMVCVAFAFAAWLRSMEAMQTVAFAAVLPLTFVSNAFVPLDVLPQWLRILGTLNPVTYSVSASRNLLEGGAGISEVIVACSVSAITFSVAFPVAVWGFSRRD